jgi:peptidyl-prolyl cis-trans isomerase B (cyclophilin B)
MSLAQRALIIFAAVSILIGCGGKKSETKSDQNTAVHDPEVAVIETRLGTIVLEFYPDVAPKHVENFKNLARSGFYNGTTFHRVIPGFIIQGGDPNTKDDDRSNDGKGGPGYTVDAEFNDRPHIRGTLSMARYPEPNTAGSQFFICVAPQPKLDRQYTVFGHAIRGMEVVDQIVNLPRDNSDNPLEPVPVTISIVPRLSIQ